MTGPMVWSERGGDGTGERRYDHFGTRRQGMHDLSTRFPHLVCRALRQDKFCLPLKELASRFWISIASVSYAPRPWDSTSRLAIIQSQSVSSHRCLLLSGNCFYETAFLEPESCPDMRSRTKKCEYRRGP